MPSCSGTKPATYADFANQYLSYATTAAQRLQLPIAFVLCQWWKEWGIPANNPAWQKWCPEKYDPPYGWCGSFPMFYTLDDGTDAYVLQMEYYCDDVSHPNVFGQTVNVRASYNWGFGGGYVANNVYTDDGYYVTVTSQHFYGALESSGNGTSGTYAANEAIGASPWDGGHYMLHTDTYPGRQLNLILNDSGWAPQYCYVP